MHQEVRNSLNKRRKFQAVPGSETTVLLLQDKNIPQKVKLILSVTLPYTPIVTYAAKAWRMNEIMKQDVRRRNEILKVKYEEE